MSREDPDRDLRMRFANGDASAVHELLHRYVRQLSAVLYRGTEGRASKEDLKVLLRRVCHRVLSRVHTYDESSGAPFSSWVRREAQSVAEAFVDEHRRRLERGLIK